MFGTAETSRGSFCQTHSERRPRRRALSRHGLFTVFFSVLVFCGFAGRKESKVMPELANVNVLFVTGNNQAALKAREMIREGKTCFTLATKKEDADAILDMVDTPNAGKDIMGSTVSSVSATLTLKSGDLVWSDDCSLSSAPFMNASKESAAVIVKELCSAADCKHRKK